MEALMSPSSRTPATTAVVTIIAKNYLAQARVLMESVKEFDPTFLRFVLLIDEPEGFFDPAEEDFLVLSSAELGIPKSRWFHFKYSVLELSTAVKPFFLSWIFNHHHLHKVIYLDPDIRVYTSLAPIDEALERAEIVLTPHLTEALDDDLQPSELQILRTGAYNLGFIALKATAEVEKFLSWWKDRLYDKCVVDLARGLFVDQKWIDLVPGMFSGVLVLRDVGFNAAYWNATHRNLHWRDGHVFVDDRPLYFFHFSGYDPGAPELLSKHQNRVSLQDREDLKRLVDEYRQELFAHGFGECSGWPYTYGRFRNSCLIPDIGRHLVGEDPKLSDEFDDPFSDEAYERILELWNTPVSRSSGRVSGVTKLGYRIYRLREDVQAAMPDIFGTDHVSFLEWMLSSTPREHLLSEDLLGGIRTTLKLTRQNDEKLQGRTAQTNKVPFICADLLENGAKNRLLEKLTKQKVVDSPAVLNEVIEDGEGLSQHTVLARYIYESRPDLQQVFPQLAGRDEAAYLVWLLTYGRHSYGLTPEYLTPIHATLRSVRSKLAFGDRIRLDLYRGLSILAVRLSPLTSAIRNGLRTEWTRVRRKPKPALKIALQESENSVTAPFGVNIYGYFRAETGVGQSARNGIDAMTAAGIPFGVHNLHAAEHSELDSSIPRFSSSASYDTSLYFVNADQTAVVQSQSIKLRTTRNVAFWTWELEEFPRQWDAAFKAYDEIWVPSNYCQAAISARSPIPVIRIPYCVKPLTKSRKTRQDFGIDLGRFVFLTIFDMRSGFDRKNPMGTIRAFKKAFGGTNRCQLIVKVNHGGSCPERLRDLQEEICDSPIRLIEDTFRHEDIAALIDACDCVVSLHRAEGFGLVLAEAMLMGKPVITTGYSGNLDFTTPDNAFLVSYQLKQVGSGNSPYPEHCMWADPSLEDAVEQMRQVYHSTELRTQRSRAGKCLIEAHFSPTAVGAAMKARLGLTELGHSESGVHPREVLA
jgi:glycosyltransferase involved in cell wall biosynthesis